MLFDDLLKTMRHFTLERHLVSEKELEDKLETYLTEKGYRVIRQKVEDAIRQKIRTDILVKSADETVCLELKKRANISIAAQLGLYSALYKRGIIVVCWIASPELRKFAKQINHNPKNDTPIGLIEVAKNYGVTI